MEIIQVDRIIGVSDMLRSYEDCLLDVCIHRPDAGDNGAEQ